MNKWFIGLKKRGDIFDLSGLEEVKTPDDIYYADPFLLEDYLFFEDYDHKKGVIACRNLKTGEQEVVLEENTHLSYPCVFKHQGKYYMTPENGASGELWLYEAEDFPRGWVKKQLIFQGNYTDPQIYFKDRFYLFLTSGGDNCLEIYTSDDLKDWRFFHRQQALHSRSAGNLFDYQGKTLRPVQNCENLYGGGIIFKEITFTDSSVVEKEFSRIDPTWREDLIGTHTFNFNDDYLVLDGKITL